MLQHESIALFYGVAHQTNGIPAIVLPWYENGTANAYLREHPDVDPTQTVSTRIREQLSSTYFSALDPGDRDGYRVSS
jgi:hypothetical protein